MIFTDDAAAISYVKLHANQTPDWVKNARDYSKELCALIDGENFLDLLILQIENLESNSKAAARKKYSKDIRSLFARLNLPIQNVFSATGGVKNYKNGETQLSDDNTKKLIRLLSNNRDNKSIERYLETQWMKLYMNDPSGVIWIRYEVDNNTVKAYPTYQSIGAIRTYEPKGQLVKCILYEPYDKGDIKVWVLVDDEKQYTINQKGDEFSIDVDPLRTFKHPFGTVPVIINSDLTDKYGKRLSPIHEVIPDVREYARDLSIKTIYKFLQGFPKHWQRRAICAECHGTRKVGDKACTQCSPTGYTAKKDVADVAILPFDPNKEITIRGDDVMGFVSPDLETWKHMSAELKEDEETIYATMWGVTPPKKKVVQTEDEIQRDTQPQINKLNKVANVAEWIEWTITEWFANAIDTTKAKDETISLIIYGRRYILEGINTIQNKYEDAKKAGENSVVLDGIFDELLTVKFKNDPEWMKIELKKSRVEPYLHYSAAEINTFFGANETARKIYFQTWWNNLTDVDIKLETPKLQEKFKADFELYLPSVKLIKPVVAPAAPVN